jgi:hypothetical protein
VTSRTSWAVGLVAAGVFAAGGALAAESDDAPDEATTSGRDSYWGPIPEKTAETTTVAEAQDVPGWELAVDTPYYVATLPFRVVTVSAEETAEFVTENSFAQRLLHLFPLEIGPARLSGGVSAATDDGFGGNLSLDFPTIGGDRDALKIRGAATTAGRGKATLGLRLQETDRAMIQIGAGYRSNIKARFYGIGIDSPEERKSIYREEISWVGLSHRRRIASTSFGWETTVTISGMSATGTSHQDDPKISEVFADELTAGEIDGRPFVGYRDRSDGVSGSLELFHDGVARLGPPAFPWPERGRPERGGIRRARVSYFSSKGDGLAKYWTWRGELQQFVPLWFTRRALAVRAYVSKIENTGDVPVPFQRLLTNDDPDLFRGYPDDRFRDEGIAALSVEYRWPVWARTDVNGIGVDAYAFADWGRVFEEVDEIDADALTASYGGGFRLVGFGRFVGRLEFGKSEEDFLVRLAADQIFQYAKGGLFHGRNPVPER